MPEQEDEEPHVDVTRSTLFTRGVLIFAVIYLVAMVVIAVCVQNLFNIPVYDVLFDPENTGKSKGYTSTARILIGAVVLFSLYGAYKMFAGVGFNVAALSSGETKYNKHSDRSLANKANLGLIGRSVTGGDDEGMRSAGRRLRRNMAALP